MRRQLVRQEHTVNHSELTYKGVQPASKTAARQPEPAWHRRGRAKRKQQRELLRAVKAAENLAGHHGTAMPPKDNGKTRWSRCTAEGKPWPKCPNPSCKGGKEWQINPAVDRCSKCGFSAVAGRSTKPDTAGKGKGKGKGKAAANIEEESKLAEATRKAAATKLKDKDSESAKLKNLLKQQAAASENSPAPMDTDNEGQPGAAASDITAANQKIKKAERTLKMVREFDPEIWSEQSGGESHQARVAKLEAELAAAHEAKRALRSPEQRKKAEEDHLKRLQGQLEEAGVQKADLVSQRAELDLKIGEADATAIELLQNIAKAKAKFLQLGDILQQELRGSRWRQAG